MNYTYDILLNFNDNLYEFYDWNLNDNIVHIRRIPIFKIESNKLEEIKSNVVKFEESFLEKVKNKTEYFLGRSVKILKYAFLLTDGMNVIAISINNNIKYSSLQIDEELDVLEETRINEYDLKCEILTKKQNINFKTRFQLTQEKILKDKLKKLRKENNIEKIKYIYYECFNEKLEDKNEILKKLNESLTNKEIFCKLADFFDLNKLTFN